MDKLKTVKISSRVTWLLRENNNKVDWDIYIASVLLMDLKKAGEYYKDSTNISRSDLPAAKYIAT